MLKLQGKSPPDCESSSESSSESSDKTPRASASYSASYSASSVSAEGIKDEDGVSRQSTSATDKTLTP